MKDIGSEPPAPPPVRPRSWFARHRASLGASLGVAIAFALLLRAGALPVVPAASAFRETSWPLVAAYAGVWTLVLLLRSARWHWLLAPVHPVPLRRVITVSFISYGVLVILPFRMGEMARPMMIRERGQLSIWTATGTVAAERVVDGVFSSVLLLAGLALARPLDPLPDRIGDLPVPVVLVPAAAYVALASFGVGFVLMALFYVAREKARDLTERIVGRLSRGLARGLTSAVERLADGLGFLRDPRYAGPFLLATSAYWLLNGAGIWLLLRAAGLDSATFAHASVVMGVLALGLLLPNAPGFFGAFQMSVYAALAMYFPVSVVVREGAAATFLLYVTQMGVALLGAVICLFIEHVNPRDALTVEEI